MHGDMDLRNTLIHFTNGVHKYKANKHKPIFAPKEITEVTIPKTVDFDHLNKETMLIISYNIEHATEEEKLQLQILSYLLFDMP